MIPKYYTLLAVVSLILILPGISQAITVSATILPSTPMTANISITSSGAPCPTMTVAFGDGQQAVAGSCGAGLCTLALSHTYATPGTYNISVTGSVGAGALCVAILPPNPGSAVVTVASAMTITSPSILPAGTLAGSYNYQLQTQNTGGLLPLKYSLVSGKLPPGLNLSSGGLISGTPTALGTSTFSIQVSDASLPPQQSLPKTFSLTINLPTFSGPSSMKTTVPMGATSVRTIPYQLSAATPVNLPLLSTVGTFSAGGAVLETNNQPLTVPMQNGQGQASETITISPSLIQKALQHNSNTILYQRSFTVGGVSAKATALSPVVLTTTLTISIVTDASAPFNIKSLQLYFPNRQVDITVDRNYPKLKAYVDILPIGTGILQGNWTVDGRIISNVVQPLAGGQAITLQTPDIPPLPTYEVGTHQLRFNITYPVASVTTPTIIYHVDPTESKLALARITLISPQYGSQQPYSPLDFQWEGLRSPSLYLIEFYNDEKGITPVFSAFTKRPHYALPPNTFAIFFEKGGTYLWKVTALNENKNPVGESDRRSFSFKK